MNQTKIKDNLFRFLLLIIASLSIVAVLLICFFLFYNGLPAIFKIGPANFLFGMQWNPEKDVYGIFPMIVASLYVTAGSLLFGVPIGLFTAVFLSKYCGKRLHAFIKPVVDLLAGIPSIIFGFFGLSVIVPMVQSFFHTNGKGILTASLLLGIMILPTIISISENALNALPESYYEGALGLGATKEQAVFKTMIPAASSGIFTAIVLALGRSIGETMAVVMVAGNAAVMPKSVLSMVRTLTSNIILEMGYASGLHREALIGTGVVLFVFILIINFVLLLFKKSYE